MNDIRSHEIAQQCEKHGSVHIRLSHSSVFVAHRDNFLWLHSIFALVYFIITLLCMAHHSIRLEYREDEKVCHHHITLFKHQRLAISPLRKHHLSQAESKILSNMISIHPEGDISACFKFHSNPSSSCKDISLWAANVYMLVHRVLRVLMSYTDIKLVNIHSVLRTWLYLEKLDNPLLMTHPWQQWLHQTGGDTGSKNPEHILSGMWWTQHLIACHTGKPSRLLCGLWLFS